MKQWLKEVVHNCICHPLLPFIPRKLAYDWYRINGKWAFGEDA